LPAVEDRELIIEVFSVFLVEQTLDGLIVEGHVTDKWLRLKLQEHLQEELWVRLCLDQLVGRASLLRDVDRLDEQQLSESDLMDLDAEEIVKLSLVIRVQELLLDANLPVIVELAREENVITRLDLEVVDLGQRVDHALLLLRVGQDLVRLLAKHEDLSSFLGDDEEVVVRE
jgi:hypothetical protein